MTGLKRAKGSKGKKSQMTYDIRKGFVSPKSKSKQKYGRFTGGNDSKPFEYKFTSSSVNKRGLSNDSGSTSQPSINYTSPR